MSTIKRTPLIAGASRPTVSLPKRSADCGKPGLSEREILLMLQSIAGSVQRADRRADGRADRGSDRGSEQHTGAYDRPSTTAAQDIDAD